MHKRLAALSVMGVALLFAFAPGEASAGYSLEASMEAAAGARQVPLALVKAIAYVNVRWEPSSQPASDGGYGPMNIPGSQVDQATALSGHSAGQVRSDPAANLDAGAALLAHSHSGGADLASWQPAVLSMLGPYVTVQVYEVLRSGVSRTNGMGESITLAPQAVPAAAPSPRTAALATAPAAAASASSDYPPATWVPASPSNFSTANRPRDYPIDMIVIHDTEGSYGSAIQEFQNGATQASAHYVVSDAGQITQMVLERDIAWHAGNWDYNTRAIGIEHEGFASGPNWYTSAMYDSSARLAASICTRWGVPMDRAHVIGHFEVPDPDNPGLYGGAGHHTDPGVNWNWNYYMFLAQSYAVAGPPHLFLDAVAAAGDGDATVSWEPARSCGGVITGYTVVAQPGNIVLNLPPSATFATFSNLQNGTPYTFTVTARNAQGTDSLASNSVTPLPVISRSFFNWYDKASVGMSDDNIHLVNPGATTSQGFLSLPKATHLAFSVPPSGEQYLAWPIYVIGGPISVNLQSGPDVIASQRVAYFSSFNETLAKRVSEAATVGYFNWYDKATVGMSDDNIHILNPGATTASGSISLPGFPTLTFSVPAGGEGYYAWPQGTIGGPVKVSSSVPVIASQRVTYFQSFNETPAKVMPDAATQLFFNWFDRASPGVADDNIHILNPGSVAATGSITLANAQTIGFSVPAGGEGYYTWPRGTIGGPVKVSASSPVFASQRVRYFDSFNEAGGSSPAAAASTLYLSWYDKATPGMLDDNIHILNPGNATAQGVISLAGGSDIAFTVGSGGEGYYAWPRYTIGGPVKIQVTSGPPVVASQRVTYLQSFNEVSAAR